MIFWQNPSEDRRCRFFTQSCIDLVPKIKRKKKMNKIFFTKCKSKQDRNAFSSLSSTHTETLQHSIDRELLPIKYFEILKPVVFLLTSEIY